jgi:hypothetical protein
MELHHATGLADSYVGSSRLFGASILIFVALLFSSQLALAQFTQQGPKLVGTGASATAQQGHSVALSGDVNQAMVGGPGDFHSMGAAWSYRFIETDQSRTPHTADSLPENMMQRSNISSSGANPIYGISRGTIIQL